VTLLRPRQQAERLGVGRSTLIRLRREEGLPAVVIGTGPRGRQIVRFNPEEVEAWLTGRREAQIRRTLDGERFTRRSAE